jgi:DNA-directed RNA polymerase omega subunit
LVKNPSGKQTGGVSLTVDGKLLRLKRGKIMIYQSLEELLNHAGNRFVLATIAAKRARQIFAEGVADDRRVSEALNIAFDEIVSGRIKFEMIKTGIK